MILETKKFNGLEQDISEIKIKCQNIVQKCDCISNLEIPEILEKNYVNVHDTSSLLLNITITQADIIHARRVQIRSPLLKDSIISCIRKKKVSQH